MAQHKQAFEAKKLTIVKGVTMAKSAVGRIFLLILLISTQSCKTQPRLVIYQSDALSVVLRELPLEYPSVGPFHHPYTVQPKAVSEVLESLSYEPGSLLPFSRTQPRSVFTKLQAERLAHELSNAFSAALPQDVTRFIITEAEKPDRQTKGLAFIMDNELHLIIEELQRPRYEGEQKTYQQGVSRWSLLPGDRQRHYTTHPGGKGAMTNWIITPL